jgi:hypothetical protein
MKPPRLRIVSVDVTKIDMARGLVFLHYVLRTSVGDNQAAVDVRLGPAEDMCAELYESARHKAALLGEIFAGARVDPAAYEIADESITTERIGSLFSRLQEAVHRFQDASLDESERALIETDGVHLLKPELDPAGRTPGERAAILLKRARRQLEVGDPDGAELLACQALRLASDQSEAREVLAQCETVRSKVLKTKREAGET